MIFASVEIINIMEAIFTRKKQIQAGQKILGYSRKAS
jgi:hypothetical protein